MKHLEEILALSPPTLRMVLCNAVIAARNTRDAQRVPLWSFVGRICSVGSTSAHDLCRHANLNPGQTISPSLRNWCDFEDIQPKA